MRGSRREAVASAAVLFVALLACGSPRAIAFEACSVRANGTPIAKQGVHIGADDIDTVRAAGGLPFGTMTMKGRSETYTADEAAAYGGTHFLSGRWVREGDEWTLAPSVGKDEQFALMRVPRGSWERLPRALRPESAK